MNGKEALVLVPGACTTVQDRGRRGLLSQGFSPSGSMDQRSAFIANALVGNTSGCAVLEFAYLGPTLRFEQPARIALTGAPFGATLDGEPLEAYRTHRVAPGSVLCVGHAESGVYGYLAFWGGIGVKPVLGSRSTSMRYGIGGYEGRRLKAGDRLPLAGAEPPGESTAHLASHDAYFRWNALGGRVTTIRVVTPDTAGTVPWKPLFDRTFAVDAQSDRMGLRLRAGRKAATPPADLPSEALAWGAIQVPSNGDPIVAMADRQTTGGYFKAGTVASVDLPRLAQCRPGTSVRFEPIGVTAAQGLFRRDAGYLEHLARRLG